MKVTFLVIGSELLMGKTQDQNVPWLARFFTSLHLNLDQVIFAKDQRQDLVPLIARLFQENDILITSGGLGPTLDDITKEVVALALNKNIHFSQEALDQANSHYRRVNKTAINNPDHPYALMPDDFLPIPNHSGLANGLFYCEQTRYHEKQIFCAPGVPHEFQNMVEKEIYPRMRQAFPANQNELYHDVIIRTHSLPEEKIFKTIVPDLWNKLSDFGEVSSLPHILSVDIGVRISGRNKMELENKEDRIKEIIQNSALKNNIWQFGSLSLCELIISLCQQKSLTLSFAESCTGGFLSHLITNVPGASQVLRGSIISYQTSVKEDILQVPSKIIEKYSVVSDETARAMSEGLQKQFKTDFSLSTTGLAGPASGDDQDLPVGIIFIGITNRLKKETKSYFFQFTGDRQKLKEVFAMKALFLLLEEINGCHS